MQEAVRDIEDPATVRRARRLARLACAGVAVIYDALIDGPDAEAIEHYARSVGAVLRRDYSGHVQGARALIASGSDPFVVTRETLAGMVEDIDAELADLCDCRRAWSDGAA